MIGLIVALLILILIAILFPGFIQMVLGIGGAVGFGMLAWHIGTTAVLIYAGFIAWIVFSVWYRESQA